MCPRSATRNPAENRAFEFYFENTPVFSGVLSPIADVKRVTEAGWGAAPRAGLCK
jgi:hypothetical protein